MAAPFRLYNTLSRTVEDFTPIQPGEITLYVCGMTVYDHAHVGHARAMVVFDAFVHYLRQRDWKVRFVRNFTDVDDKIILRANERNEDPMTLAERYITAFGEDAAALGLMAPDEEPRVSQSIEAILALISRLLEQGNAYVNEGTVWFSVKSFNNYGKLSGQRVEELRNPDTAAGKHSPADFALWKAVKPGEPFWESPWGPGRPGWHIECSAMACEQLGQTIDIHGGGLDLVFPHHENEIAQSQCGNGNTYCHYWMHNGLLTMSGGQKMGKSLGNVINVREALQIVPAEALRLYYLQNHYRSPLPWNAEVLDEALVMLARLYDAVEVASSMKGQEKADDVIASLGESAEEVWRLGQALPQKMYEAMDQDFNTAKALGYVFELARAVNRFAQVKKAKKRGGPVVAPALAAFSLVSQAIKLLEHSPETFAQEVKEKRLRSLNLKREDIEALLNERTTAREQRDWAEADRLRLALEEQGIMVMDRPEGATWRFRL